MTTLETEIADLVEADNVVRQLTAARRARSTPLRIVGAIGFALAIITGGYYVMSWSKYEAKIDGMVERLLQDDTSDKHIAELIFFKQYCKLDVPVVVDKIITKYKARRSFYAIDHLVDETRNKIVSNAFFAMMMSNVDCKTVQSVVDSYAADFANYYN